MTDRAFIKQTFASNENPLPGVWDSRPVGIAQAVVVSGASKRIYLSGQAAMNTQGEILFPGDKVKQTEICFQNIDTILRLLGASLDDVVQCSILVSGYDAARDLEALLPIWRRFLGGRIASTLHGVQTFVLPGMVVEIDAIAEIPAV